MDLLRNKLLVALFIYIFPLVHVFGQEDKTFQNRFSIQFIPKTDEVPFVLGKRFFAEKWKDSLQIDILKFYISAIELLNSDLVVWTENESFHLINVFSESSVELVVDVPTKLQFNTLKFNIGIDSLTNVSGAMGGDLDPTKGMYWTWQNGYINFKLEGKSKQCKTRNNEFKFHLGGYQFPENALQTIILDIDRTKQTYIQIDLTKFIEESDLLNSPTIMSPGKETMRISAKLPSMFSIQK